MSSKKIIDLRNGKPVMRKPTPGPVHRPPQRPLPEGEKPATTRRAKPLRVRKRQARLAGVMATVLVVLMLVGGVSFASYMPRFSVQTVTVSGAKDIEPSMIQAYVDALFASEPRSLLSHRNIFLYPRAQIEQGIENTFPRIRSAAVSRPSVWSTELHVAVIERTPYALWCDGESCYLMDDGGLIYASADGMTAGEVPSHYAFGGGIATGTIPVGQRFVSAHLPGIVQLMDQLGRAGLSPDGATIQNDSDFSVHFVDDSHLLASYGEDPSTLVRNLQIVLSSDALKDKTGKIDYVDLRFGDKVYYRLKGESQSTASTTKPTL